MAFKLKRRKNKRKKKLSKKELLLRKVALAKKKLKPIKKAPKIFPVVLFHSIFCLKNDQRKLTPT